MNLDQIQRKQAEAQARVADLQSEFHTLEATIEESLVFDRPIEKEKKRLKQVRDFALKQREQLKKRGWRSTTLP